MCMNLFSVIHLQNTHPIANLIYFSYCLQTIAHETGHNLGMAHDFNQKLYEQGYRLPGKGYVYRKYRKSSREYCRGLMDYIDDGVGWSWCSARDFSRYLTSGGTKEPCLKGNSVFSFKKCFQTENLQNAYFHNNPRIRYLNR